MSAASLSAVHQQFEAALPAVTDAARYAFRRRRPQDRDEAIADARAAAWSAWHGLIARGKDPVEVGVHGIAANAVRYVRNGRRVRHRGGGRGSMDGCHPRAQAVRDFKLVGIDAVEDPVAPAPAEPWRQWLAEDNRVSPADEAAFRIDFAAWLANLPERKRRVAELLAEGHEGVVVARLAGVSPGRVCQIKEELAANWEAFQGQACAGPRRTPP